MPIPKNVTFVTFDVYGTLIDWETGIYEAFAKEAARDEFEIDRAQLIALFHEISREIEGGSYELYAEVLRRTAIEIAKRLEWPLEPSRSGFLPDSVQRWKPFKETNTQLQKLAKKYKLGLLSNIDDKLLGQTRRHIPTDFDLVVTAQQVRSYKPEPAHFTEWLGPCRLEPLPRRRAVHQSARPRDLGEPLQGDARLLAEEADARGDEPQRGGQSARRLLAGSRREGRRAAP
jgi:2-haloacid dehalogenase/putative hydrolase of the HAD superfamily